MSAMSSGIQLSADQWAQMEADVTARHGEEACGFILGKDDHSELVIPVTNSLHDPFRFRMDPEEELKAFLLAESKGWDILAVYHSHPYGISTPSASDLQELTLPGIIYLIWYQAGHEWTCRGFLMQPDRVAIEVHINLSTKE